MAHISPQESDRFATLRWNDGGYAILVSRFCGDAAVAKLNEPLKVLGAAGARGQKSEIATSGSACGF